LQANGLPPGDENWLQVMRLLVALRQSLPPFVTRAPLGTDQPQPMNIWSNHDVFGIALNIMQAAAPPSDHNLFAFDRINGTVPFRDPNNRMGIRVSPYVTETALRAERISSSQVKLTQYIEFWNPYAVPLTNHLTNQPIKYYYGNWVGSQWNPGSPSREHGLYSMNGTAGPTGEFRWPLPDPKHADPKRRFLLPEPGKFVVVNLPERIVTWETSKGDLEIRARPYIQNSGYWENKIDDGGPDESTNYAVSIGPFYTTGTVAQLVHVIPATRINRPDPKTPGKFLPAWHSFQIDDPRMGPFTRYQADYKTGQTPMEYSWQASKVKGALPIGAQHTLFGIANEPATLPGEEEKATTTYGDGYNFNFGANWPKGTGPAFDLKRAYASFALPRRAFANLGEMGTVFANRPWRTLSFGKTIVPGDPTVTSGVEMPNFPTALLDYLTTLGTTTDDTKLNYKAPGAAPNPTILPATIAKRKQSKIWLFEDVIKGGASDGEPILTPTATNLRPIRGRINLNSATKETLRTLLAAPYRVVRWVGLLDAGGATQWDNLNPKEVVPGEPYSDVYVSISEADAEKIAFEIAGDLVTPSKVRPFRSMADLSRLTTIGSLHLTYPDPVVDAVVARLAQFGTVRQQVFRVDVAARALNRNVEKQRASNPSIRRVVTAEVRFQTRLYFDTFSRRAFVESIEYR
jgi:hypothetical protein